MDGRDLQQKQQRCLGGGSGDNSSNNRGPKLKSLWAAKGRLLPRDLGCTLLHRWNLEVLSLVLGSRNGQTADGLGLPMDFAKKEPGVLIQISLVLTFGRCLQKELEQPKGNNKSIYIYFDRWRTTVGRT